MRRLRGGFHRARSYSLGVDVSSPAVGELGTDRARAEFGRMPDSVELAARSACIQNLCRKRELLLAISEILDHYSPSDRRAT